MDNKKQLFRGPLDGLFVICRKQHIKGVIKYKGVLLICLYEWSEDKQGYCYRGTYDKQEVPKTTDTIVVDVDCNEYGVMYDPKPANTAYKVKYWRLREQGS